MSEDMTPSKDEMISSLEIALKAQSLMTDALKETIKAQDGIIKHYAERIEDLNRQSIYFEKRCNEVEGYWVEECGKKYETPNNMSDALDRIANAKNMTARGLSEYAGSVLAKARGETPETDK